MIQTPSGVPSKSGTQGGDLKCRATIYYTSALRPTVIVGPYMYIKSKKRGAVKFTIVA